MPRAQDAQERPIWGVIACIEDPAVIKKILSHLNEKVASRTCSVA